MFTMTTAISTTPHKWIFATLCEQNEMRILSTEMKHTQWCVRSIKNGKYRSLKMDSMCISINMGTILRIASFISQMVIKKKEYFQSIAIILSQFPHNFMFFIYFFLFVHSFWKNDAIDISTWPDVILAEAKHIVWNEIKIQQLPTDQCLCVCVWAERALNRLRFCKMVEVSVEIVRWTNIIFELSINK